MNKKKKSFNFTRIYPDDDSNDNFNHKDIVCETLDESKFFPDLQL